MKILNIEDVPVFSEVDINHFNNPITVRLIEDYSLVAEPNVSNSSLHPSTIKSSTKIHKKKKGQYKNYVTCFCIDEACIVYVKYGTPVMMKE